VAFVTKSCFSMFQGFVIAVLFYEWSYFTNLSYFMDDEVRLRIASLCYNRVI
jgi:hypothetical protein